MALFDTDVLIDHLRGFEDARELLLTFQDEQNYCSVITTGEILFGMKERERNRTFALIENFEELVVDNEIVRLYRRDRPKENLWSTLQHQYLDMEKVFILLKIKKVEINRQYFSPRGLFLYKF